MTGIPFDYTDFRGGLNSKDQAFDLVDNEARDLLNVQATLAGAIVKRNGLVTFASPPVTLTSLFPFDQASPTVLVGAGATSLYGISTGGTATAIKTGLTSGLRWEFFSAPAIGGQGTLFGMNGVDTPQQWNGTAGNTTNWTATTGTLPNGKYVVTHQNQVYVAGVAANPSRVFVSAIADPTSWDPAALTGAVAIDFSPSDGQPITGLGTVGPYVLVCKPRKLFIIADPGSSVTSTVTRQLSDNVGCVAHRSIASGPEGTYFLGEDRGVYLTNGSKLTPISDKIQPTIDLIEPGLRGQAAASYFNAHYYLSVPMTSLANDTTLDYDATLGSWWKHSFGSNQMTVWHPLGVAGLYSAKATSAIVDQCFAPNVLVDNGSAFGWVWRGPWQSPTFYRRRRFPTPDRAKRLRQVRLLGSGTVDLSLAKGFAMGETLVETDIFNQAGASSDTFGGTGTFGGAGTFGGDASIHQARIFGQGVSNAFSLVFSSTSTTQDTILLYTLMMTDRRDLVPA